MKIAHWVTSAFFLLALSFFSTATVFATPADFLPPKTQPQFRQTDSLTGTLKIEAIANLGVPVGNAAQPRHVALNNQAQQVYLLSDGDPPPEQGIILAVFNIEQGEIVGRLQLNQGDFEPLDLQFDPDSGLLYALWRKRYGVTRPTLSIIDSKMMQVVQEVPDVEAFTTSNSLLYTANAGQIAVVNPSNNSMGQARRVELPPATRTGPLAVSPAANRLYLARNIDDRWSIEIFEADSLSPVTNYPTGGQVLNIFPLPDDNEALFTTISGNFRILNRITGKGEMAGLPTELGPYFEAKGIALSPDGETLFYSNGLPRPVGPDDPSPGPALVGLNSTTLLETHHIPLLTNVDDVAIDSASSVAFAVYPFDHYLYTVDLANQNFQINNTLIQIRDVLVDEKNDYLFVSDSANRIRQLERESLEILAETTLQNNRADYGFTSAGWGGELTLDADRNHLYVSGRPATVLEAGTLKEIATLKPGGQLAPDSSTGAIYVSNCGVTALDADTFSKITALPNSGRQPDVPGPNPCVTTSQLDALNQRLYSIAPNGVPGSNGGNHLYVYNLSAAPTRTLNDNNISTTHVNPDPAGNRAFTSFAHHSNRRIRTLDGDNAAYRNQLMGSWGHMEFSPATNRLYLGDRDQQRLLTLDGDTLSVIDALPLPANDDFRLVALDAPRDKLYLAGAGGNLLIAAPGKRDPEQAGFYPLPHSREANGSILSLFQPAGNHTLAQIEAKFGDFSTEPRLYHSAKEGQNWLDLSRNLPPHPVHALAVSPNFKQDQTLFVSQLLPGQAGGLLKSTDGGQSWQPAMNGLRDLWVDRLFISPTFGKTGLIMAKTSYGGLHISTDGGQQWQPLIKLDANATFPTAGAEVAAAFGSDTILVSQAMDDMRGIFRATIKPGGKLSTWEPVFDIPATHLALSPNGKTALAFGLTLWRSADGGQSWQIGGSGLVGLDNLQPDQIIFSPNFKTDQTAYFFFKGATGSNSGVLFRSADGGQTWQPWRAPNPDKLFTAITLAADGDFLLGDAAAELARLSPAQLQWAPPPLPTGRFPIDSLAGAAGANQTLFAVSRQQGLFKSTNGGRGWQLTGFPARTQKFSSERYRLAISPDFDTDQTLYIATGLSLHRSTDGGGSWQQLSADDARSFQVRQVALSPDFAKNKTLFAATPAEILRSTDSGDTWEVVLAAGKETATADLLIAAPDAHTVYARFGYGHSLRRSTDNGNTWETQPANRDEFYSLLSASVNSNNLLSAAQEYERKLIQTGPQTLPWNDAGQNLPEKLSSLKAVAYRPDDTLFVAGQGGIFSSQNEGQSWQVVPDTGLPPNADITGLYVSEAGVVVTLRNGSVFSGNGAGQWKDISIVK